MGKASPKQSRTVEALPKLVESETWAPRYLTHKYWGRKPANVVRQYIEHYTAGLEDPVVFDPFCGSGVTCIEALALGKRAVGIDINPVATLITRATGISPVDIAGLNSVYRAIISEARAELGWLYATQCPECGNTGTVQSVVWDKDQPVELKYTCANCGGKNTRLKPPDAGDLALIEQIAGAPIPYWYPDVPVFKGWQTLKLFRANLSSFRELYTRRNLWALAALWNRISQVEQESLRLILQVTFTSVVAQCTKMIADFRDKAGGPSWKINTYWLPPRWQELNVFHYFANRYSKMRKAKEDTNAAIGDRYHPSRYQIHTGSSHTALVAPASVDYVFTDPPYGGEGIQYLELSALWNMWLEKGQLSFDDEVAFNPYRSLDSAYYADMLAKTFKQAYMALKPDRWMTVTFHNKDLEVWRALLLACASAGFVLESIVPVNPSAPNLTQKLTPGAPKTDLLLNFRKPAAGEVHQPTLSDFSFGRWEDAVVATARNQLETFGTTSASKVFDAVVIKWFTAHFGRLDSVAGAEMTFTLLDVDAVLESHFPTLTPP